MLCKKSLTVTRFAPHTKKEQVSWPTPLWLRRLDLNQRPSGLSHKALPCLPLENIVALLAWSASQFSLFSHLSTTPVSATGGGVPLRPNERSSSRHNPERKKSRSLDLLLYGCGGWTWTNDLRVMSPTSYRLLHSAIFLCHSLKALNYYSTVHLFCQ